MFPSADGREQLAVPVPCRPHPKRRFYEPLASTPVKAQEKRAKDKPQPQPKYKLNPRTAPSKASPFFNKRAAAI